MVKFAETKYGLRAWLPLGGRFSWLLALGWWLLLGLPLRRNLRSALGRAAAWGERWTTAADGPPVRPRRPKAPRAPRRADRRPPFSAAAA